MINASLPQLNKGRSNPLILVPGLMASNLWSKPRLALTPPIPVWPLNPLNLTAQLVLLRASNPLEADGLLRGYYDGLIEFVERADGLGRRAGRDFWVFAYDWRQSCRQTGQALSQFIANRLQEVNLRQVAEGQPPFETVDVIAHSLGGLVTRAAMSLDDAPVERVAYIATPHYGVAKAFFAIHPNTVSPLLDDFIGDFLPGPYWELLKILPNVILVRRWLSRLLTRFEVIYELLPDRFLLADPANAIVLDATHQPPDPVSGLEDTYYRHGWQLPPSQQTRVKRAMAFKEDLGPTLPGDHNLSIYSPSLPTYAQAYYRGRLEQPQKLAIGDASITAASANQDEQARRIMVEGSHSKLPNSPQVHQAIKEFFEVEVKPISRE